MVHRFLLFIWCSRCFIPPQPFEAVYCFICGCRSASVARYRMNCLVLYSWFRYNEFKHIFSSYWQVREIQLRPFISTALIMHYLRECAGQKDVTLANHQTKKSRVVSGTSLSTFREFALQQICFLFFISFIFIMFMQIKSSLNPFKIHIFL